MTQLVKFEAACRALAECKAVDEVKSWADKAAAMQAYGRMAKDKTLEIDASEIRIRAERRLGEMLSHQKSEGGLSKGAAGVGINQHSAKEVRSSVTTAPKLADAGISKDLSSRAQKLAAVPEAEFEAEVGAWRERVSAEGARVTARLEAAGEREQKKPKRELTTATIDLGVSQNLAEACNTITEMAQEIEQLRDKIAVENMDAGEDEKTSAARTIAELRDRVKTLERDLDAVKLSRDTFQRENSELKTQVQMLMRKLKKAVDA
jgi:hypothetical protein